MNANVIEIMLQIARIEENIRASKESIDLARREVDRRLIEMNDLRQQINIERSEYLTRTEFNAKYESIQTSIMQLQKFQWIVTGGLIVFQILLHFLWAK